MASREAGTGQNAVPQTEMVLTVNQAVGAARRPTEMFRRTLRELIWSLGADTGAEGNEGTRAEGVVVRPWGVPGPSGEPDEGGV